MISVIIPAYNRQDTITRAVESVLCQTYSDIEVIVVDDCSKDNTVATVKKIKDERLRVIECKENSGACRARNIGIDYAKGEYISFQDSDDVWHANKLEIELKKLIDMDVDVVGCGFFKYDGKRKIQWPTHKIEGNYLERVLKGNYVTTQAILAKKECLQKEKFDISLKRYQDWELVIRLLKNYKFYFINEALIDVYLQNDSITKNHMAGADSAMYILEKHKELYRNYPKSDKVIKKIYAYGKMQEGKFEHNYYKDILSDYGFDIFILVRSLQYELRKRVIK